MDRQKAKQVIEFLQTVLDTNKELFEEDGVAVKIVPGGTIHPTSLVVKIELCDIGEDGEAEDKGASALKLLAKLNPSVSPPYGFEFIHGGRAYKLVGYVGRRGRFPLVAERQPDGRRFKFGMEHIRGLWKLEQVQGGKKKVKR
jgi:hypothetical protein